MILKAIAGKSNAVTPKVFIFKTIQDLISGYKSSLLEMVNLFTGKRREKFGLYFEVEINFELAIFFK